MQWTVSIRRGSSQTFYWACAFCWLLHHSTLLHFIFRIFVVFFLSPRFAITFHGCYASHEINSCEHPKLCEVTIESVFLVVCGILNNLYLFNFFFLDMWCIEQNFFVFKGRVDIRDDPVPAMLFDKLFLNSMKLFTILYSFSIFSLQHRKYVCFN